LELLGLTLTNQVASSFVLAHKDREGLLLEKKVTRGDFINNKAKEQ